MTNPQAPKILVVRFSAIGDCVIAAWAVTALRKALPQAHIVWAAQERCAPVVANPQNAQIHLAERVHLADLDAWKKNRASPRTWRAQLKSWLALRQENFDVGFDLQGHGKTAVCLRLSGAKTRLANRATDPLAARCNTLVDVQAGQIHEVQAALRLLQSQFPCQLPDRPLMPDPVPLTHLPGLQTLPTPHQNLVTIQTGAGHADKAVPPKTWAAVAEALLQDGHHVVFVGAPGDPLPPTQTPTNLVGKLTLPQTISLVALSQLHISADTGTAHIAAAYRVPTVTVFGPTEPARFQPWPLDGNVIREGRDPAAVPPQTIVDTARQALAQAQLAR